MVFALHVFYCLFATHSPQPPCFVQIKLHTNKIQKMGCFYSFTFIFFCWWDAEWKCKLHIFTGGIVWIIIHFLHNSWNIVPVFNQLNQWLLFWNCDTREGASCLKQKSQVPQCLHILSPLSPCHVFAQHDTCLSKPTHYPSGCSLSSWRFFSTIMFKIIRSLGFKFWMSSWCDYWNRD